MIIDTHSHYDDEAYDADRETVINSLKGHGVELVVDIGADMESSRAAVKLAGRYENVYAAVGCHPNDVEKLTEADLRWMYETALTEKKVLAVGEIGLDYHYPEPSPEVQKEWFTKQLDLALKLKLPVCIHSRNAAADTLAMIKDKYAGAGKKGETLTGVIHCFSYGVEIANEYLKMGFFLGIGGVSTFKNEKKLRQVVKAAPLGQLVLETDCPYLTPEGHRGERNVSWYLDEVAEKIAEFKEITAEEVIKATSENAHKLYPRLNKA